MDARLRWAGVHKNPEHNKSEKQSKSKKAIQVSVVYGGKDISKS